jgi:hypothetical protein
MSTLETPKRRRGWLIALIIVVVLIGALVGAFFVADAIARNAAEKVVAEQFASRLSSTDSSTAASADDVQVHIGGTSVILQYLGGRFDTVDIDASDVAVEGIPIDLTITGTGVPADTTKPIDSVTGSVSFGQAGLDALLAKNDVDADITLGDGVVTYTAAQQFLGIPLSFTLTAEPSTTGDSLVITPKDATLAAGSASIDVSGLVDTVLADNTISFCIADQIPAGVSLAGVTVTPTTLQVGFSAKDLVIGDLAGRGSCG